VSSIRQANGLSSDSLWVGQALTIPGGQSGSGGTWTGSNGSSSSLSQSDIDLLAHLVSAEAGGESYTGQVAVAATVLNRLRDARYPKTIAGIIYEYSWGAYQYTPVQDGRINLMPVASAYTAAQEAAGGSDPSGGANGFYNPVVAEPGNWVMSQPVTAVIGNHIFFRS
jgi:N-acetylmuramoyl-L-alanine amidase